LDEGISDQDADERIVALEFGRERHAVSGVLRSIPMQHAGN
jgi:hypothetical protein